MSSRQVVFTRNAVEFHGIESVARAVHRVALPVLRSWPGRVAVAAIVLAGVATMIAGRPDGPAVSREPWIDLAIGLALGYALAASQELAHAVTLVHYGRSPRRMGCGFFKGTLCFYVDELGGVGALPRSAKVVNLLAGFALFLVICSPLLVIAQVPTAVILTDRALSGLHPAVARRAQERVAHFRAA